MDLVCIFQGFCNSNTSRFNLVKIRLNAAVHHDFWSEIGHDDNACAGCCCVFNGMSMCDGVTDRNNNNIGFFHGCGNGCRRFFSCTFSRLHRHHHDFSASIAGNGCHSLGDIGFRIVCNDQNLFTWLNFCGDIDQGFCAFQHQKIFHFFSLRLNEFGARCTKEVQRIHQIE